MAGIHHHCIEAEQVDLCTHLVAAYQKVVQILEKEINHKTMTCMLVLVLPSLDTTTSHGISPERKSRGMDINHIYHTLVRKMRWG